MKYAIPDISIGDSVLFEANNVLNYDQAWKVSGIRENVLRLTLLINSVEHISMIHISKITHLIKGVAL